MTDPIIPVRLPLEGINPFDPDDVRAWYQAHLDQLVPLEGQPWPGIHLLFDGHREVIDLPEIMEADPDFDPAATYQAQAGRPDVRCAVLVAMLQREDGALAALVVSVDHALDGPVSWWATWRGYHTTDDGAGLFTSDWEGDGGEGSPPGAFAALVVASPGSHPAQVLPGRMPEPDVRAAFVEVPAEARLPTTAEEMAQFGVAQTMPTVLSQGFDHARIVRLRGRDCEIWEVRGRHLPSSIDDLIRYICQFGEPAEAVAYAAGARIIDAGQIISGVRIVAEMGGKRAEQMTALHWPPGEETAQVGGTRVRELPIEEGESWLGVDPLVQWEMYVKSPFE